MLAPNTAKQKAESKAYRNGCNGVALNGVARRLVCAFVLIIRQIRNAAPQIAQVVLHRSRVRNCGLSRSGPSPPRGEEEWRQRSVEALDASSQGIREPIQGIQDRRPKRRSQTSISRRAHKPLSCLAYLRQAS